MGLGICNALTAACTVDWNAVGAIGSISAATVAVGIALFRDGIRKKVDARARGAYVRAAGIQLGRLARQFSRLFGALENGDLNGEAATHEAIKKWFIEFGQVDQRLDLNLISLIDDVTAAHYAELLALVCRMADEGRQFKSLSASGIEKGRFDECVDDAVSATCLVTLIGMRLKVDDRVGRDDIHFCLQVANRTRGKMLNAAAKQIPDALKAITLLNSIDTVVSKAESASAHSLSSAPSGSGSVSPGSRISAPEEPLTATGTPVRAVSSMIARATPAVSGGDAGGSSLEISATGAGENSPPDMTSVQSVER